MWRRHTCECSGNSDTTMKNIGFYITKQQSGTQFFQIVKHYLKTVISIIKKISKSNFGQLWAYLLRCDTHHQTCRRYSPKNIPAKLKKYFKYIFRVIAWTNLVMRADGWTDVPTDGRTDKRMALGLRVKINYHVQVFVFSFVLFFVFFSVFFLKKNEIKYGAISSFYTLYESYFSRFRHWSHLNRRHGSLTCHMTQFERFNWLRSANIINVMIE